MGVLLEEMSEKARQLGIPLSVQLDLTYRCNERCVHCYLDHDDHGEMTTPEIKSLLHELADAGAFVLTLSGGEIMLRRDFFEILEHSRKLTFCVKLKTNAILIGQREAERIKAFGVESIQVSIYSHRAGIHDAITKVPGSLDRSLSAIRRLKASGLKVIIANVLMAQNHSDYSAVRALAAELGVDCTLDPTVTPKMDGDRSILRLNASHASLRAVFVEEVGLSAQDSCSPNADDSLLDSLPCSAGHTACYVSPYGDVYPCVQFPLPCGNVRHQRFLDIWHRSNQLSKVRSIRLRDLTSCSQCLHVPNCTRCPGLAYMEGNMLGPSIQDCEKSFARSGIPSANLLSTKRPKPVLVQIQA